MKLKSFMCFAMVFGSLAFASPSTHAEEVVKTSLPVEKAIIEMKGGKTHEFDLEIAKTPVDQQMGLMFRKEMAADHGMMFQFQKEAVVSFWMKNTLIPLDMLFVAKDGRIVNIHRNAVPGSLVGISSIEPVTGVVELNGGRAEEVGIAIGDKVIHDFFKTPETP